MKHQDNERIHLVTGMPVNKIMRTRKMKDNEVVSELMPRCFGGKGRSSLHCPTPKGTLGQRKDALGHRCRSFQDYKATTHER